MYDCRDQLTRFYISAIHFMQPTKTPQHKSTHKLQNLNGLLSEYNKVAFWLPRGKDAKSYILNSLDNLKVIVIFKRNTASFTCL